MEKPKLTEKQKAEYRFGELNTQQARDNDAKRMWEIFQKHESAPCTMTATHFFTKYAVLFLAKYSKSDEDLSPEEFTMLANLSEEYRSEVNIYKTLFVVDDYDHNKILFPIAPVLLQVPTLSTKEGQEAIDIFTNMHTLAYDQPWKKSSATHNLLSHIQENFNKYKPKVDKQVLNTVNVLLKAHESEYLSTKINKDYSIEYKQQKEDTTPHTGVKVTEEQKEKLTQYDGDGCDEFFD